MMGFGNEAKNFYNKTKQGDYSPIGSMTEKLALSFFPVGKMSTVGKMVTEIGREAPRLISNINRVSSNFANQSFISKEASKAGWNLPYPADIDIRQISLNRETHFARVFSGNDCI